MSDQTTAPDPEPRHLAQTEQEALDEWVGPEEAALRSYAEQSDGDLAGVGQRSVAYGNPDDPVATGFVSVITGKGVDALGALGVEPPCLHRQFLKDVTIERIEDEATGEVISWQAALKVICAECSRHFTFTDQVRVGDEGWTVRVRMEAPAADDHP